MKNDLINPQFFLYSFKHQKEEMRELIHKIMLTRMTLQNISDLIPPDKWTIERYTWDYVRITGNANATLEDLDRIGRKLSKAFNSEPQKDISKDMAVFSWFRRPRLFNEKNVFGHDTAVLIEFAVGNTEKCDFIEKTEKVKRFIPTGYCKSLYDRKYLEINVE